ncbi:MAG: DUF2975 domain-containing protein [Patescibacteria group bacterium]
MKKGSTLLLKGVIFLIGAIVLFLCAYVLPQGIMTDVTGLYRPILIGLYFPAIPFFVALYQALKLLNNIDKGLAFSNLSTKALNVIKYCAIIISILYAIGMPFIFIAAEKDDAPGVIVIGLVIIFASVVIATFAAVLQKLLQEALDIKAENELTV